MALRQRLEECLVQTVSAHHRTNLQQTTQHNHIKHLSVFHLSRLVHRINTIHGDVLTLRRIHDTIPIIDQHTARLNLRFKLIERRLIQYDSHIIMAQDRRRDTVITHDYRHIRRTATLFRTVCRHPSHLFILHQSRISQDFSHRENTLTTKPRYNDFCLHF